MDSSCYKAMYSLAPGTQEYSNILPTLEEMLSLALERGNFTILAVPRGSFLVKAIYTTSLLNF